MKINKFSKKPLDAIGRTNKDLVISYPVDKKKNNNLKILLEERKKIDLINEIIIPPRDAKCFTVKAGQFFRIECFEGSQVGDLNLFNLYKFRFLRWWCKLGKAKFTSADWSGEENITSKLNNGNEIIKNIINKALKMEGVMTMVGVGIGFFLR